MEEININNLVDMAVNVSDDINNYYILPSEDICEVNETAVPLACVSNLDAGVGELLDKWNLPQLKNIFAEHNIDLECLKYLTEKDIDSILPAASIADKIKFRGRLAEWRIEQGLPVASVAETISATSSFSEEIKKWLQNSTVNTTSSSRTSRDSSPAIQLLVDGINLDDILLSSSKGVDVANTFKTKKVLDKHARNQLITCVVDYFVYNKIRLGTKEVATITEKIVNHFPGEAKESYFIPADGNGRARGALYTKYNNTVKFLRKKNVLSPVKRRCSRSPLSGSSSAEDRGKFTDENTAPRSSLNTVSPDCESEKNWLKHVADPWEVVEIKWRNTFALRREEILKKSKELAIDIFLDWPLLTQEKATRLIDLDFIELYGVSKSMLLLNKWEAFVKKCVPTFKNQLRGNKCTKRIVSQLDSCPLNSNDFTSAVFKLLHYVLPPSKRIKVSVKPNKKDLWHPSIQASIDSTLLQVTNYAEIKVGYNKIKEKYKELKLSCQPLIVSIDEKEFFVVSDNIFHKASSMLTAIDTVFKLFFVLNLEYPPQSYNVWSFIQNYLYEIIIKNDKNLSSTTTSFITQLEAVL